MKRLLAHCIYWPCRTVRCAFGVIFILFASVITAAVWPYFWASDELWHTDLTGEGFLATVREIVEDAFG